MPRTTQSEPETVLLRIKRFDKQWATCGVGIVPPPGMAHDPRMKRLCPKLVPGQVIELPVTHPLVKKRSKLVEQVDGPEKDEYVRPWVFHSAEEAALGNPSKSRLGPQQILDGLTLRDGAIENAPKHREKARKEAAGKEQFDRPDDGYGDPADAPEPEYEDVRPISEDERVKRSQNRAVREEPEEPEEAPAPRPRQRSRRSRS